MATTRILSSERLDLCPFGDEHLTPRYVAWLNDQATVRYSEQRHRVHTLDSSRAYARSFADTPHYFWAIVAHDPALGHIGNISARVDLANRVADLAILIGQAEARGRGFGSEAWQCACDYLLAEAGMRKIAAGTMASNLPMLAIMRACGMIEEGRRRRHFLHEGQEVDLVMAALFASEITPPPAAD